jgi:hypothetical protein
VSKNYQVLLSMMIDSKIYRGIEYVQLAELPEPQRKKLIETFNHNLFIKILIDGKVLSKCVQYKDYYFWYKNIYQSQNATIVEQVVAKKVTKSDFVTFLATTCSTIVAF